jgi:hypothetical protein
MFVTAYGVVGDARIVQMVDAPIVGVGGGGGGGGGGSGCFLFGWLGSHQAVEHPHASFGFMALLIVLGCLAAARRSS